MFLLHLLICIRKIYLVNIRFISNGILEEKKILVNHIYNSKISCRPQGSLSCRIIRIIYLNMPHVQDYVFTTRKIRYKFLYLNKSYFICIFLIICYKYCLANQKSIYTNYYDNHCSMFCFKLNTSLFATHIIIHQSLYQLRYQA